MKNLKLVILVSLVFISSCDIDRLPYDSMETQELLGAEGGLEAATLGNYSFINGGYGQAAILHRIGEFAGDNVSLSSSTTSGYFNLYTYNNITTNSYTNNFWNASYKPIVGINKVLELTEEGVTEETDQLIGENYYLRGLLYFGLVNAFGRPYSQNPSALGVPLKLTSDVDDRPDRSTVGDVYQQVIKDLEKAESLMTISKSNVYASKYAAQALLSRVHLYMENNQKAIAYSTKVIESEKYSLISTPNLEGYFRMTPTANNETIFASKMEKEADDYNGGVGTVGAVYSNIQGVGYGEMFSSSSYLNLINKHPEDARKGFIDPQYLRNKSGEKIPAIYWVDKDNNYVFRRTTTQDGTISFDDNGTKRQVTEESIGNESRYYFTTAHGEKQYVHKDFDVEKRNGYPKFYILKASLEEDVPQQWSPVISRLAEMYLNRAEANAKSGNFDAALEDVNIIRSRANIPTYQGKSDFPIGMDILDIVLQERRLELAFEGHRKFDVFRNNKVMNRRYPGVHLNGNNPYLEIAPSDARVILFIPDSQIIVQPSLEQNP